jgi:hypothetical protein
MIQRNSTRYAGPIESATSEISRQWSAHQKSAERLGTPRSGCTRPLRHQPTGWRLRSPAKARRISRLQHTSHQNSCSRRAFPTAWTQPAAGTLRGETRAYACPVPNEMRLSDAGLRRLKTMALYPDHRLPPWCNPHATSNRPAAPMPPPMHMVVTTYLTPRRLPSISA